MIMILILAEFYARFSGVAEVAADYVAGFMMTGLLLITLGRFRSKAKVVTVMGTGTGMGSSH